MIDARQLTQEPTPEVGQIWWVRTGDATFHACKILSYDAKQARYQTQRTAPPGYNVVHTPLWTLRRDIVKRIPDAR